MSAPEAALRPLPAVAAAPAAAARAQAAPLRGRGWDLYLLATAALSPVLVPPGPLQMSLLDGLNAVALAIFGAVVLVRRVPVPVPFAVPALLVAAGSLLATANASSMSTAAVAMAVDLYLYLWVILLLALLARRGDARPVRMTWFLVSLAISGLCVWQSVSVNGAGNLLAGEGYRAVGTFANANICSDFLVLSVFIALSLVGQTSKLLLLGGVPLLMLAIVATKSNGGLLSLAGGLAAAAAVWAFAGPGARAARLGVVALLLAAALAGGWATTQWSGSSDTAVTAGGETILDRGPKSVSGRRDIWENLLRAYTRSPLGIGPANSVFQPMSIGHRVRVDSFEGKEAHNDYIAYLVERGPLALLGLLLATVQATVLILTARRGPLGARRGTILAAAYFGALVASSLHSISIEKLHFRHFWLLVALGLTASAGAWIAARETAPEAPRRHRPCAS